MITWQITRRRVAIAGRVTDDLNGKPIGAAEVTLLGAPPTARKTRTRPDGLFYFMDLPDGDYALSACDPSLGNRYGTSDGSATVSRDAEGDSKIPFVNMTLHPTMVEGRVTAANRENGVAMAELRLRGSGERVFSDAMGHYALPGIEPGKRTIVVSARDFQSVSKVVTLERGQAESVSFFLDIQAAPFNGPSSAPTRRVRAVGRSRS